MRRTVYLCECLACTATPFAHGILECDNEAHYFIRMHMVDVCHLFEGGSAKALVCLECFDAYNRSINKIIADGMSGARIPVCQGESCGRYLTRTKAFFEDVQSAESYIAEMEQSEVHRQ